MHAKQCFVSLAFEFEVAGELVFAPLDLGMSPLRGHDIERGLVKYFDGHVCMASDGETATHDEQLYELLLPQRANMG